ncbi:MAG: hypothetical protein JW940_29445 [Polyangiaceae bacterium]|nr:hypothetical protein [Polyangiaceae bacterium]
MSGSSWTGFALRGVDAGFFAAFGGTATLRPVTAPFAGAERRGGIAGTFRGVAATVDTGGDVDASGAPVAASGASVDSAALGAGPGSAAWVDPAGSAAGRCAGASVCDMTECCTGSGMTEMGPPGLVSRSVGPCDLSTKPIAAPAAMIPTMIAAVRIAPDLRTLGASSIGKPPSLGGSASAASSGADGGAFSGSVTLGGTVMGTVLYTETADEPDGGTEDVDGLLAGAALVGGGAWLYGTACATSAASSGTTAAWGGVVGLAPSAAASGAAASGAAGGCWAGGLSSVVPVPAASERAGSGQSFGSINPAGVTLSPGATAGHSGAGAAMTGSGAPLAF